MKLPGGKEATQAFSVLKFGNEGALKLAVEARNELLGLVEDKPFLHHLMAKQSEKKRIANEAVKSQNRP